MKKKDNRVDVIIPLGDNPSKNNNLELRFALRSIEKNLLDVRYVYIVTEKLPDWVDDVVHVKCSDLLKHNKDGNIINKVLAALENTNEQHIDVLDNFVFMADDNILAKPMSSEDIGYYHLGTLEKKKFDDSNAWHMKLLNGYSKLKEEGKPVWNWESHCPVVMEKYKFINVYRMMYPEFEDDGAGYTIYTMYFNNYMPKVFSSTKGVKSTFEDKKIVADESKFMGYNDQGFTEEVKKLIKNMFPKPSRYEKNVSAEEAGLMYISMEALQAHGGQLREDLVQNYVEVYHYMSNHRSRLIQLLQKAGKHTYAPIDKDIKNIDQIMEIISEDITLKQFNEYKHEEVRETNCGRH